MLPLSPLSQQPTRELPFHPSVASQLLTFRTCLALASHVSDETTRNSPCKDHLVTHTLCKFWGLGRKECVVPLRKGNSIP